MSKQITITRDGSYQDIDAAELDAFEAAGWTLAPDDQGGAAVMPTSHPASDWPGDQTPKAKPARKAQTPGSHKPKGKAK